MRLISFLLRGSKRHSREEPAVRVSSHVLSDVDRVCDRVGIIREGRIVAVERIDTLKAKMGQVFTVDFDRQLDADNFRMEDLKISGVSKVQLAGHTLSLHVTGNHDGVLKALSGYKITKLLAEECSLDNLFLEYYQYRSSFGFL